MLMPIKDFIHTALVDIARGIHDANEDVHSLGVEFAPRRVKHERNMVTGNAKETHFPESEVAFDIAVTVAEEKTGEKAGKASISVLGAHFGAGGESHTTGQNNMVSRIQFSIKASLHHHEPTGDKGQK